MPLMPALPAVHFRPRGQPAPRERKMRPSERLVTVTFTARRRAARSGDRQTDTAHLLHSLIESECAVGELLEGYGPGRGRVLGYLVQRGIGYGMDWRGVPEGGQSGPGAAGARVVAVGARAEGGPGWSVSAAAALEQAWRRARGRGLAEAGPTEATLPAAGPTWAGLGKAGLSERGWVRRG
jgi:hypothetical protein